MRRKSSRWLLAGALIAAHAGGACVGGYGGGTGTLIVAQLEDGRWARGYAAYGQPNSTWKLRLKDGRYMHGDVISEEMAQNYLNPPVTVSGDDSDADTRQTAPTEPGGEVGPGTDPDPDPGTGPGPDPDPDPGAGPGIDPDPDPGTGCDVDYEC